MCSNIYNLCTHTKLLLNYSISKSVTPICLPPSISLGLLTEKIWETKKTFLEKNDYVNKAKIYGKISREKKVNKQLADRK